MPKRILVTSTDLMMIQFLVPHVINLSKHGFDVEIACSDVGGRVPEIREKLNGYVKTIHIVQLVRSPASLQNIKGYQDMKKVIEKGRYDIIWTNEPVMGVVTRLAARKARKNGTKVIYMVHGFHFYKGAPKLNWLIYYPIEKYVSRFCDEIVTINKEDYRRAEKMHASSVKYIHGIGVDTERLQKKERQNSIREELGLKKEDFLILSIGELSKRKNHQVIIKALGQIKNKRIHYLICGKGDLLKKLQDLAKIQGVKKNVHFLGYRDDVVDICSQVDLFILPSLHEGLSVASLEAMYCGLPVVISNIRGVHDYLIDGKNGFICDTQDVNAYVSAIKKMLKDVKLREQMGDNNRIAVMPYCLNETKKEVLKLLYSVDDVQ